MGATDESRTSTLRVAPKSLAEVRREIDRLFGEMLPIEAELTPTEGEEVEMPARILDIRASTVRVEVLLGRDPVRMQVRTFDRDLVDEVVTLDVGAYISIRRFKRPGLLQFTFSDDVSDLDSVRDIFEDDSRFSDLDDFEFDRAL